MRRRLGPDSTFSVPFVEHPAMNIKPPGFGETRFVTVGGQTWAVILAKPTFAAELRDGVLYVPPRITKSKKKRRSIPLWSFIFAIPVAALVTAIASAPTHLSHPVTENGKPCPEVAPHVWRCPDAIIENR